MKLWAPLTQRVCLAAHSLLLVLHLHFTRAHTPKLLAIRASNKAGDYRDFTVLASDIAATETKVAASNFVGSQLFHVPNIHWWPQISNSLVAGGQLHSTQPSATTKYTNAFEENCGRDHIWGWCRKNLKVRHCYCFT